MPNLVTEIALLNSINSLKTKNMNHDTYLLKRSFSSRLNQLFPQMKERIYLICSLNYPYLTNELSF